MRVRVDQNKCMTNGECVKICPSVFRFQPGNKKAHAVVDTVPREFEPDCLKAAFACPQKAVIVTDYETY